MMIDQAGLDQQCFELMMSQLKFDKQAYKVYCQKYEERETAIYHQKLQWRINYHTKAKEAAQIFMQRSMQIVAATKLADVMQMWGDFVRQVRARHPLPGSQIITLALLNWVSPCNLSSEFQDLQSTMLGCLVNDKDRQTEVECVVRVGRGGASMDLVSYTYSELGWGIQVFSVDRLSGSIQRSPGCKRARQGSRTEPGQT